MEKKITAPRSVYKGRVCEEKKFDSNFSHIFSNSVLPQTRKELAIYESLGN